MQIFQKKLTNQELFVSEEITKENCTLKENEFFWFDILECKIIEDGRTLGIVKDIHRYPLDDYLEITTDENLVKENLPKTFLIPYNVETIQLKLIQRIKLQRLKTVLLYQKTRKSFLIFTSFLVLFFSEVY